MSLRRKAPKQRAVAARMPVLKWQIGEIEAGIAELDAGDVASPAEVEKRYGDLLKRRHRGRIKS